MHTIVCVPSTQKEWIKRLQAADWVLERGGMMGGVMSEAQQLHVNVHLEDESLWATVYEFPGVFATGDNLDELRESLQEGIALVLAGPGEECPAVTLAPLKPESMATTTRTELIYA